VDAKQPATKPFDTVEQPRTVEVKLSSMLLDVVSLGCPASCKPASNVTLPQQPAPSPRPPAQEVSPVVDPMDDPVLIIPQSAAEVGNKMLFYLKNLPLIN
jgi:hypothetical protein